MIDSIIANVENLQALGLLYDGVGVFILGIPMFFRAKKDLMAESGTYWNYNKSQIESLARSRVDIPCGSTVLIIGFCCQFIATVGVSLSPSVIIVGWIIVILLPFYYFIRLRPAVVKHLVKSVMELHDADK